MTPKFKQSLLTKVKEIAGAMGDKKEKEVKATVQASFMSPTVCQYELLLWAEYIVDKFDSVESCFAAYKTAMLERSAYN